MLPEMAVAAKGEVRSILVLAKKPIELARRIALDTNSRSSVALTRLLCRGLWGIAPEFVDAAARSRSHAGRSRRGAADRRSGAARAPQGGRAGFAKYPARRDAAEAMQSEQPVPGVDTLFVYDVAQQWREMTGKPCVLAVWAGRRELITPEVVADFLASQRIRPLAHRRNRRRRGAEARSAAERAGALPCARISISRSTPKISPACNITSSLRRRRTDSQRPAHRICRRGARTPRAALQETR